MSRLSIAVLGVSMALACGTPAHAAATPLCSTDALLSLVDTALKGQPSLSKFAARRYGVRAAFLKIRYGNLKEQDAAGLVDSLLNANVHGAEEMGLAWSISRIGDHQALPRLAKDRPGTLTVSLPVSVIRALL